MILTTTLFRTNLQSRLFDDDDGDGDGDGDDDDNDDDDDDNDDDSYYVEFVVVVVVINYSSALEERTSAINVTSVSFLFF